MTELYAFSFEPIQKFFEKLNYLFSVLAKYNSIQYTYLIKIDLHYLSHDKLVIREHYHSIFVCVAQASVFALIQVSHDIASLKLKPWGHLLTKL